MCHVIPRMRNANFINYYEMRQSAHKWRCRYIGPWSGWSDHEEGRWEAIKHCGLHGQMLLLGRHGPCTQTGATCWAWQCDRPSTMFMTRLEFWDAVVSDPYWALLSGSSCFTFTLLRYALFFITSANKMMMMMMMMVVVVVVVVTVMVMGWW